MVTIAASCSCQVCTALDEADVLIHRHGLDIEEAARWIAEQHDDIAVEGFINAVIERQTGAHRVRRTTTA